MPMNRGMDETLLRIGHACSLLADSIKDHKSQDYVNGIADALALVFDLPAEVILERSGG